MTKKYVPYLSDLKIKRQS